MPVEPAPLENQPLLGGQQPDSQKQSRPSWLDRLKQAADTVNPTRITMPIIHALRWGARGVTHGVEMVTGSASTNQPTKLPLDHLAIYLLHGTADQSSGCSRLAGLLRQQLPSFCHVITPDFYACPTGSKIEDYATELVKQCNAAGAKNVVVIGHSRGGLIAAHFALYLAQANGLTVHQLESIVSPFQGSELANYANSGMQLLRNLPVISRAIPNELYLTEMAKGSPYLQKLSADLQEAIAKQGLFAHFHGASSDVIVDWRDVHPSGKLGDDRTQLPANFHMTQTKHCHLSLMTSGELANGIIERVKWLNVYRELADKLGGTKRSNPSSLLNFHW